MRRSSWTAGRGLKSFICICTIYQATFKKTAEFPQIKTESQEVKTTRQTRTVSRKATRALSVQQCFSSSSSSSSSAFVRLSGLHRDRAPPRRWRPIVWEWLNTHEGLVSVIVCYSFAVIHSRKKHKYSFISSC